MMLTVTEVAEKLGASANTVRNLIESGSLPAINISPANGQKTYRIRQDDLESFLKKRNTVSTQAVDINIAVLNNPSPDMSVNCYECGKQTTRREAFTFGGVVATPEYGDSNWTLDQTFTCSVKCLKSSVEKFTGKYVENLVNKYLQARNEVE